MKYHKYLEKQIAKYLPEELQNREDLKEFLKAINTSYRDFERDKEITNHAFEISEEEFSEVNSNLTNLIEQKNKSFDEIKSALHQINPEAAISPEGDDIVGITTLLNHEIKKRIELESLNKKILETALNGILYFDVEGNIIFWNEEAQNIFGLNDFRNQNFLELFSLECQNRFKSGFNEYFDTGKSEMFGNIRQSMGITSSGRNIFLEMYVITIERENDVLFCAFLQDKTEQILADHKLKEQEKRYRGIINNINLGLIEVDIDEKVNFLNQSFTNLSGYTLEELKGKKLSSVLEISKNSKILLEEKKELRKQGTSDMYEIMVRNKNGDVRWWVISGSPMYDDYGKVIGSIGIHLDVTDRKELETSLIVAKEEAERNLNIKESILATMSHEIRTPLNGILGMLNELVGLEFDEEVTKKLNYSLLASNHLISIVNNILDYSKIEAGQMKLFLQPASLEFSFDKVLKILYPKIKEKNLEINFKNELDSNHIFDPLKIEQILFNVIGNAIKFTDRGSIDIRIWREEISHLNEKVFFYIQDSGIGMNEETVQNLFIKYAQGQNSNNALTKGTGLGMAITKELTHLMNGKIDVKSKEGEGTRFTFQFDFEKYNHDVEQKDSTSFQTLDLKGKKILVVDDDELNRIVAENTFKSTNADIDFAENGAQTIIYATQNNYDIILLDMFLPDKNGDEITRILRQEHELEIPIIGLSANINQRHIDACLEAGMNEYLAKPYKKEDLFNVIQKSLTPDASLYDLTDLQVMGRGNKDFTSKMIKIFIKNARETVQELSVGVENQDLEKVKFVLHKIKPSIQTLKIKKATEFLLELEKEYESSNEWNSDMIPKIETIKEVLDKAVSSLKKESMI